MPLNGSGKYTPPAGNFPAVAGTLIQAEDFNTIILDMAEALSTALYRDGQAVWDSGATQEVEGTVFDAGAAATVNGLVDFTTAPTAPTLPNGTNTTQVATTAFVQQAAFNASLPALALGLLTSDGVAANFGQSLAFALNTAQATVASHASTAPIWAALGNEINYTGTATALIFPDAPQAGATRNLYCVSTPAFTAGPNMEIDGYSSGETMTCAAGDIVRVLALTTNSFKLTRYRRDGFPIKSAARGAQVINSGSGNFVVPPTVTLIHYRIKGAGGGIDAPMTHTPRAAGGGGYCEGWLTVTPGQAIPYSVGAGGAAGGGDGGDTTFGPATAGGGKGCTSSTPSPGGTATGGDINIPGSRGFYDASVAEGGIGLFVVSGFAATGVPTVSGYMFSPSSAAGTNPGSGAAGAPEGGSFPGTARAGAPGQIIIDY